MNKILLILAVLALPLAGRAQEEILDVCRQTNDYFMNKYADPTKPTFVKRERPSSLWTRAVYYEGLQALNDVAPEQRYVDYTDRWADFHKWTARNGTKTTHADDQCCQQTYLDRYFATGDTAMITKVKENLAKQMASGRDDYWTWIDAIQMAMPVYSKMYKATGDRRYMDYAMDSYTWSRDTCGGGLFNEKEGLWWRDKDYVPPYKEKDGKNCYWSRGNGWVYAAYVRVMSDLSPKDPYYKQLKKDFIAMSKALVKCQREDGFWNVSLVSPVTYGGPEMTGTALFLYGMSWGIMNGILKEKDYLPVCEKAWKAIESTVHPNGFLGYNQGTGKDPSAGQPVTFTSIPDFEDYGTGCFLLGATEYYKLLKWIKGGKKKLAAAWPEALPQAKAGTRWWWPGSAVDSAGLAWNLDNFSRAGIGTVEITPIYGVTGNEARDIAFLSPEWMKALTLTHDIAVADGVQVDMNNGTGWPFGSPEVTLEEAARKAIFIDTIVPAKGLDLTKLVITPPAKDSMWATLDTIKAFDIEGNPDSKLVIAVFTAPTRQKVKRAAPGGEGWVIDHFNPVAVDNYFSRFDKAFKASKAPWPATFFNDSYEVYGANWTPALFDEFARRRGYRLEDKLPELLGIVDDANKTLTDYRETLSDLLYENFTRKWADWAHSHGVSVRNQAHGSPANLLDIYGAVDIPEIEGFGLSSFGIRGLRDDSIHVRHNDSDVSMLKYASSAAHVMGRPLTSSETFTWLTEHFRTSLSQMKPDLDLMFTCGVNRMFFHGSCYTPADDEWPGWRFYASVDMTPENSIWRDAPFLLKYIERAQSFLQMGRPDNDFLVYLPVRDMWAVRHKAGDKGLLLQFDIHSMKKKAPDFIKSVLRIDSLGFDCDYISDRQLLNTRMDGGELVTEGGARYKAIIIPTGTTITPELKKMLDRFPGHVIYGEDEKQMNAMATPEQLRAGTGLRAIRRSNPTGHHYFIANLSGNDVNGSYPLAVDFVDAVWFNPMDGTISPVTRHDGKIDINLASGESRILRTYDSAIADVPAVTRATAGGETIDLTPNDWSLTFTECAPETDANLHLKGLSTWEKLDGKNLDRLMGTGVYTTTVNLDKQQAAKSWTIDLGDVRESARVYVNGTFAGCTWAAPFRLDLGNLLKKGENTITIEVTNLPANRIADLDRRGVKWRKMKEINVVGINYKNLNYGEWPPVPSGLNSTVKLIAR